VFARLNVVVVRDDSPGDTLVANVKKSIAVSLTTLGSSARQIGGIEHLAVGGLPADVIQFSYIQHSRKERLRQIIADHNGFIYAISFGARSRGFRDQASTVSAILSDWRWC
jgi:hypothetical protein